MRRIYQPRMPRYGFIVLAIDCLLIEALQAFIEGRTDTRGHSGEMFLRFLTSREQFKKDFDKEFAGRFYEQIRCGILHQAETRKWRVWAFGPLLQDSGDQVILNRTEFHSRLKREFDTYLSDLRKGNDPKLRSNLKTKMNHICTN